MNIFSKRTNQKALILLISIVLFFQSCEKEKITGRLSIFITDAPFPIGLVEEANITVFKLQAHAINAEEDSEMITLSEDTLEFNLMNLRNGVVEALVEVDIEAGEYDYFRLFIDDASLKLIDGRKFDVKTPSGSTSGIKLKVDPVIIVDGGLTTELIIDVDLSKSFVLNGNISTPAGIKGVLFKPVIRAFNISEYGSISGKVNDSNSDPIANVLLSVEYESEKYSTFSDSTGYYSINGIPTGIHTLRAEKESFANMSLENIVIVAANMTTRNLTLVSN